MTFEEECDRLSITPDTEEWCVAQQVWHDAQEAMRERAARACEGWDGPDAVQPGDGPDCWDWHSKDYAAMVRALEVE